MKPFFQLPRKPSWFHNKKKEQEAKTDMWVDELGEQPFKGVDLAVPGADKTVTTVKCEICGHRTQVTK